MARAKRTDRAEARRRYRAEAATRPTGEPVAPVPPAASAAPGPARQGQPLPAPPRTGIVSAFRGAFRPVDIRGDLRYLPRLVRHRAVLIPAALTILATLLVVGTDAIAAGAGGAGASPSASASASASTSPGTSPSASSSPSASASASASASPSTSASATSSAGASPSTSASASAGSSASPSPSASPAPGSPSVPGGILGTVGVLLFQFFVATPPVAAAFITGFLAPRASWLAGLITALVAVACLAIAAYASPGVDASVRQQLLTQALVISPVSGALYAAAAAWYKRFLAMANPNRTPPPRRGNQRPVRSRPNQRRR